MYYEILRILKKVMIVEKLKSSLTDKHIVDENLLRAFCKLLYLQLCVSSDQ